MPQIEQSPLVVSLGDPAAAQPALTGHKAANLARLLAHGLPVPPGIVLTAPACAQLLDSADVGSFGTPDRVRTSPMPGPVREAVRDGLATLGEAPFAVRSSGLSEDLAGASFAGQYRSVIGVRGFDEVGSAIQRVLASAFSDIVRSYRTAGAQSEATPMAVLIQRMVSAEAAGVAFTANPVTGDRDEVHVSAVRGMGESLVAELATPDHWVVRDRTVERQARSEGALTVEQVRDVARLAARVEEASGGPQDVEWAMTGDELFLLQARPITALPEPPELDVPAEGFWTKDEGHYHQPITPFGASFYLRAVADALGPATKPFGVPIEAIQHRSIGGEVYTRAVPLGGKERPAPPWWAMTLLVRLVPALRRCAASADRALRSGLPERAIQRWEKMERDRFRREATDLRRRDLATISDDDLAAYLHHAINLLFRGEAAHFRLLVPYALILHELCVVTHELLGWTSLETMALLSGLSDASSEPGRHLTELADVVSRSPAARRVLEEGGGLAELQGAAPDVAAAWKGYLEDYGHRPFGYDPGEPTLAERPDLLSGFVRDRLNGAWSANGMELTSRAREEALSRAREALSSRPSSARDDFEEALAAAERVCRVRDDSILYAGSLPAGLAHTAGMEIGRRLTERGILGRGVDAMFMSHGELRVALLGAGSTDLRSTVTRRRAERAWVAAHPGPATYGRNPGPPPDLRGVPKALRRVLGALTWFQSELIAPPSHPEVLATPDEDASGRAALRGFPGAPGRHSGSVRIVGSERQFDRLGPGDVLVCSTTSAAWSVLFLRAGALVTDVGGVLSHAAIVAREYGIPAVLSTGDGTRRLRDGQVVTVDGTAGIVVVETMDGS